MVKSYKNTIQEDTIKYCKLYLDKYQTTKVGRLINKIDIHFKLISLAPAKEGFIRSAKRGVMDLVYKSWKDFINNADYLQEVKDNLQNYLKYVWSKHFKKV